MGVPPRKKFWNEITTALRKQQRVFLSGTENAVNKKSSFIEAKPFLRGGGTMREWIRLLVSCHRSKQILFLRVKPFRLSFKTDLFLELITGMVYPCEWLK